jgi:hypothetical protein
MRRTPAGDITKKEIVLTIRVSAEEAREIVHEIEALLKRRELDRYSKITKPASVK